MSLYDFLLGDVQENAEREYANYDYKTGKRKKDLGDHLGDLITGRGSAIDKAVQDEHVRRLTEKFGVASDEVNTYLGDSSKIPEINKNTSTTKLEQELKRAAPKVEAVKDAKRFASRNGLNINLDDYAGDADAIYADTKEYVDNEKEQERKKLQGEQQTERLRQEKRSDDRLLMQMLQSDKQSDRQFQLQQAQNNYNNRRLEMQDARAERKDRQAMIMMLMKGLGQMGQAIAI